MKSKKYLQYFMSGAIVVFGSHIILAYLEVFKVSFSATLKLDSIVFIVFALGALFIADGLKRNAETFVNRFLILTTFQMLAMMAVLLAMVYVKFPDFQTVGFHTVSVFAILLIIQSLFLIRGVNAK